MEEAFEEGQGPHRAVEPMMMMMYKLKKQNVLNRALTPTHLRLILFTYLQPRYNGKFCKHNIRDLIALHTVKRREIRKDSTAF
jgi:hypothetical protein